MKDKKWNL